MSGGHAPLGVGADADPTQWGLALETCPPSAAPAQGVVVTRAALAEKAGDLARRAARYPRLRLGVTADAAIFWSAEATPLPWFASTMCYLGPPERRMFTPVGWRLATPPILQPTLFATLSAELETPDGALPPLLLAPDPATRAGGAAAGGVRVVDLSASAALPDIDWRRFESLGFAAPSRTARAMNRTARAR